jgi:hypothetical protein
MAVFLERFDASAEGVFGRLTAGSLSLYTGELPYRHNLPDVSSLPPGSFRVAWTFSPRFKRWMYLLLDTGRRTGIRFHAANLMGDLAMGYRAQLNGCIALGEKLGHLDGQKALLVSAPAVRRFEEHMGGKPFLLEIRNA